MYNSNVINRMKEHPQFQQILSTIETMIQRETPSIIAIDGRCTSGKSTLANSLQKAFDCNVFHMDDYFLPFEMKTDERLREPGGNVHYERFKEEIIQPLLHQLPICYQPYDCQISDLSAPITKDFKKLTIIEGVYSMHPSLMDSYDYKIFLTVDYEEQLSRIQKRNGEKMLQKFVTEWIPLEENYFNQLRIPEKCNIIINTSQPPFKKKEISYGTKSN